MTILLRLVNQILDFRKYENGKLELLREKTDMRASLDDWCEAFRSLAVKKHIRFTVRTEDDGPVVAYVDTEKMERILFNLLANAFKFTPENGRIDVVQQAAVLNGASAVQLTVQDTGGISVEHIRHVFDLFYQAGVNHDGSGIGLALAKAFTELHGGTIAVESDEGRGTRFTVTVPCRLELCAAEMQAQAAAPRLTVSGVEEELYSAGSGIESSPLATSAKAASPQANPSPAPSATAESEARPTVLCIDDNPDIRSYVSGLRNLIANRRRLREFFADRAALSASAVSEPDKSFADRFRTLLDENLSNAELSVEELGEKMGLSRTQLYRKLKALTNYSPVELLRIARLKRAQELLSRTDKAISEVAYLVGFSSPSYFTAVTRTTSAKAPATSCVAPKAEPAHI